MEKQGKNMYNIDEYRKAYVEVLAVINELDKEDYEKIPKDRIEHMEKEKDKNYSFTLNKKVLIKKQTTRLTRQLLANIFYNYIADESKRIEIQKYKMQKKQESTMTNIEVKPLFDTKNEVKQEKTNNNSYLPIKRETGINFIICKIKNYIKSFINKITKN